MNSPLVFYGLILLLVTIESSSIALLKHGYLYVGILGYIGVAILFYNILSRGKLALANALWQSSAIILVSLISIFYFKEKLPINEWIGLGLAILAVIIISYDKF